MIIDHITTDAATVHGDEHIGLDLCSAQTFIHYTGYLKIRFAISIVKGDCFSNGVIISKKFIRNGLLKYDGKRFFKSRRGIAINKMVIEDVEESGVHKNCLLLVKRFFFVRHEVFYNTQA